MCPKPPKLETIFERSSAKMERSKVAVAEPFQPSVAKERHISISSGSSGTVTTTDSDPSVFNEHLVEFLGRAMERVAKDGDLTSSGLVNESDVFVGLQKIPQISLRAYIRRMLKYIDGPGFGSMSWKSLSLGARSLIFALIYIDRIAAKTNLQINSFRIHRLIATGILVALKMNEDDILDMHFFAQLAGIPLVQLNKLEKVFLSKIEFDTFVSEAEFSERVKLFKRLSKPRGDLSS